MHVPRFFPSDTLFICAESKPKFPIMLNIARKDIENPMIPIVVTAYSPHKFARKIRLTSPIVRANICEPAINVDFLPIIDKEVKQNHIYK